MKTHDHPVASQPRMSGLTRDLIVRAALLALAYALVHWAGWRRYTCFLSGTMADGATMEQTAIRGILYALAHIGFWVLMPVFMLAAGWNAFWTAMGHRKRSGGEINS